jgi:hypothetical protein
MNRRLFQRCVLWLLPLLLLRAIVPAGFMLSAGASGLELTFCSAQSPMMAGLAGSVDHAAHAGHDMFTGGTGTSVDQHAAHHAGKHFDSPCPFGVAAAAIASDVQPVSVATVVTALGIFEFAPSPAASSGPLRADRIRGPPLFS